MKINPELAGGALPGAPGRIDEVSGVQSRHSGSIARTGAGTDRVDISDLAGGLASASDCAEAEQANKVEKLAAAYRSGQYQVDAAEVSHALIRDALSRGSEVPE